MNTRTKGLLALAIFLLNSALLLSGPAQGCGTEGCAEGPIWVCADPCPSGPAAKKALCEASQSGCCARSAVCEVNLFCPEGQALKCTFWPDCP